MRGKTRVSFLFAKRKKFHPVCWGLRVLENVPFSHCALYIDDFVYESVFPKSRAVLMDNWARTYEIVEFQTVIVDEAEGEKIRNYVRRNLMRKRYSLWQISLMALGMAFHSVDSYVKKKKWNGTKYLVCTELIAIVAHKYFGVEFDEKLDTISLTEAYLKIEEI